LAKKIKDQTKLHPIVPISLDYVKSLGVIEKNELSYLISSAIEGRRMNQVSFFLSENREKKSINDGAVSLLKAVSLEIAGAQGESLIEVEDSVKLFSDSTKIIIKNMLLGYFSNSLNKEKTSQLESEIEMLNDSGKALAKGK